MPGAQDAGQNDAPAIGRVGPRPLALHLSTAMTALLGGVAALPMAQLGLAPPIAGAREQAAALAEALRGLPADRLMAEAGVEARRRLETMLRGVRLYQSHPYRRQLAEPPTVWREGGSRLLDYGGATGGHPVLFVPSLINRGYVLDLTPTASLVRWLARRGVRPLLLEWGAPGEMERAWSLTDYVAGRLDRVLDRVLEIGDRPPAVVGYCMGGNLALALALRRQSEIAALAVLATPWDFHAGDAAQGRIIAASGMAMEPVMRAFDGLPVDVLQAFFLALDPTLALRKFTAFAEMDPDCAGAEQFVALEDWLNDGIPLAAAVARECFVGWYGDNEPAAGTWRVAGEAIDPGRFAKPSLAAIPARDRIVPPASAQALADRLPACTVLAPDAGHIGMVVGSKAERDLWRPLSQWLKETVEES